VLFEEALTFFLISLTIWGWGAVILKIWEIIAPKKKEG